MTEPDTASRAKRPEFRNIHLLGDLTSYRMPLASVVSILHRISGAVLFLLLPFVIWMFDTSVSSEISFTRFTGVFEQGVGVLPGWLLKLVALALIWAFLHHLIAGMRHVRMDIRHAAVGKDAGRRSAVVVLVLSIGLTVALGAKLFGAY